MTEEAWHLVKDTPKVTGFIGNQRPQEVRPQRDRRSAPAGGGEGTVKPKPRVSFDVGDEIRVIDGAFANFTGHGRRGEARQAEAQGQSRSSVARRQSNSTSARSRSAPRPPLGGPFCRGLRGLRAKCAPTRKYAWCFAQDALSSASRFLILPSASQFVAGRRSPVVSFRRESTWPPASPTD